MTEARLDLVVVGAGPNGLATALWAARRGLEVAVVERGRVAENIARFPQGMIFFGGRASTEIAAIPLDSQRSHPTREDALSYFGRVAALTGLRVHTSTPFEALEGADGDFVVRCRSQGEPLALRSRKLVIATGVFGQPKRLDVPGIELPRVSYGYRDPYEYCGQDVLIVGAGNGAAEAALRLRHEARARVTVLDRADHLAEDKWRWRVRDLSELIEHGGIRLLHRSRLLAVEQDAAVIETPAGHVRLPNHRVLVLIGYRPDTRIFDAAGVRYDAAGAPELDPVTLETSVKGVYVAGAACAGDAPNLILIAGGRGHGRAIVAHIRGEAPPVRDLGAKSIAHWTQFHCLSEELPREVALELVPVVPGEFRDNLLDLFQRKLLLRHAETLALSGAVGSELLCPEPVALGPPIEELPEDQLSRDGDAIAFKGRRLPLDALELLRLADGRKRLREIVTALLARHEADDDELERQVVALTVSLLRAGRLHWRTEPLPGV